MATPVCDANGKPIVLAEGDALSITTAKERVRMYYLVEDGAAEIHVMRERVNDGREDA